MTTPFDVLRIAVSRWLHDYHHRAQAREKQIKRWRKFVDHLTKDLEQYDIHQLEGWYLPISRPKVASETHRHIAAHILSLRGPCEVEVEMYPVRALFSRMIDVRVSGPGGSVVFGRKTNWGKGRK